MAKIVVADDHALARGYIKDLLREEPGVDVFGEASDGVEAVELTAKLKPDILVTDLKMPRLNGIEVTTRIRQLSPNTRIIILSLYGDKVYVDAALKAGARAYVLKKFSADGLIDAVRAVAAGKNYLSPSLSENTTGFSES
jgi:NarL family two-component system response regulator LiaR